MLEPSKDHQCELMDTFSVIIQTIMGIAGISTLLIKRRREKPKRPRQIWLMDVGKQISGAFTQHFVNIFVSMILGGFDGEGLDCVWYFLTITVDTFLGTALNFLFLRFIENTFITPCNCKRLKTGDYGNPPKWLNWTMQVSLWIGITSLSKCVIGLLLFLFDEEISWFGLFVMWPFVGHPKLELLFVMVFTPFIMNVISMWTIDSFLKNQKFTSKAGPTIDEEDQSVLEPLGVQPRGMDDSDGGGDTTVSGVQVDIDETQELAQRHRSPAVVPARYHEQYGLRVESQE